MKSYIYLVTMLALFSCSEKEESVFIQNIPVSFDEKEIKLSSFVDSISYVFLDGFKSMDEIKKIKFNEDRIYCLTQNQVLEVFDKSGKYLFSIDKKGKGPGEYIYLNDFDITEGKIILQDLSQSKLLFYNEKGMYTHEVKLDNPPIGICALGNNQFWFYNQFTGTKSFYRKHSSGENYNLMKIKIVDNKCDVVDYALQFPDFLRWAMVVCNNEYFYNGENSIYFCQPYDNKIYKIDSNFVKPIYKFNFGREQVPYDLYENKKYGNDIRSFVNDGKYIKGLKSIFLTKNYVIGTFTKSHLGYTTIFNKKTNSVQTGYIIENDIDSLPILPNWNASYNDSSIVSIMDSYLFMDELKRIESSTEIMPQMYKIFQERLDYNSNPVVAFLHLKN